MVLSDADWIRHAMSLSDDVRRIGQTHQVAKRLKSDHESIHRESHGKWAMVIF